MIKKRYYKALTIAGSDCGGGAGIQADLKTFSALGCYGMSVITALTAQNTRRVSAIHAVPPAFVTEQLEAVFTDMGADAVKIGMLYSAEVVETVAAQLKKHQAQNIVMDAVTASQRGEGLLQEGALEAMKTLLFPLATMLTPNLGEASAILNRRVEHQKEMEPAARDLASYGSRSVLIKGGHLKLVQCNDLLFISPEDRCLMLRGERIATGNNHGTGCALSAAIACFLARGFALEEAAAGAKEYVAGALRAGAEYELGAGRGPLHHHYSFW